MAGGLFDSARMESGEGAEDYSGYRDAAGFGNFRSGAREQHASGIVVDHDFDYRTVYCGAGGMVDAVIDRAEGKLGNVWRDHESEQPDRGDFGADSYRVYRYSVEELLGCVPCVGGLFFDW